MPSKPRLNTFSLPEQDQKDLSSTATLDLTAKEFNTLSRDAITFARDYFAGVNRRPVLGWPRFKELRERIQEPLPVSSTSPRRVFNQFLRHIYPNIRHNLHPRFFGYVSSSGNPVGAIADLITSTINQNVTSWRSAASAVETELLVTDWIKQILGYPRQSIGMLTSGGSTAILQALAIAREIHSGRDIGKEGLQSLGRRRMILYMSKEGHMAIPKAAALLGLGKNAVRVIRVKESYQMDVVDLQNRIADDRRRGHLPFCVVASAGTVGTGAIDDLAALSRLCKRERLWFHVDGAYGGFAALTPRVKKRFRGIEKADSVSLDPHKWLYEPLDAGCVLVRERSRARRTFSGSGDYARVIGAAPGEDFAFFEHGIELSRRFRALKLWMVIKCYGTRRLAACVEKNLAMARYLKLLLENHEELELLAPVELSIVCFRFVPRGIRNELEQAGQARRQLLENKLNALNTALMTRLQHGGIAYVSNAVLNGRFALRACILSYKTEARDVEILVDEIIRLGKRLTG